MTEQDPDSNLKGQDYETWAKGKSTEALDMELSALELRRMVLEKRDPEREALMEMTVDASSGGEEIDEWIKKYNAEMAAATTPEEENEIRVKYEGGGIYTLEKGAEPPPWMDPIKSKISAWVAEHAEVKRHIRIVERELARRDQELSKSEAASALATAQELPKRSVAPLLLAYRSELKRAILMQLAQNPRATDLDICRGLDADGAVELPGNWKKVGKDSSFADTYMDSDRRHKVEIEISKVRSDLRKRELLAPR